MKVALLTDGIYPYVIGGMQKHSYYLTKYLARQRVQVNLYHTGPAEANTTNLAGFTKKEMTFINPIFVPFPSSGYFPGHYLFQSSKYSEIIFKEVLEGDKTDLIYCQGLTGWEVVKKKNKGAILPTIISNLHGLNMYQYQASIKAKFEAQLLRVATDTIIQKSDYVISLGGRLTFLLEKLGVDASKIIEQPIGVEQEWLIESVDVNKEGHKTRRFVFIGRYDKVKGIDLFTHILPDLQGMDFEFYFVGPIPPEKQIKQKNVHYLGLIQNEEEIRSLLLSVDILVCPSYSEGMPTVILEGMASGLAIIASDVGAVKTMVSEENGWLIKVADKQALKQTMIEGINLSVQELYQKKKASLRLVKEQFTWDTIIKTTVDTINHLKEQKP